MIEIVASQPELARRLQDKSLYVVISLSEIQRYEHENKCTPPVYREKDDIKASRHLLSPGTNRCFSLNEKHSVLPSFGDVLADVLLELPELLRLVVF